MKTYLVKAGVQFKSNGWHTEPLPFFEYRLVEANNPDEAHKKFLGEGVADILSSITNLPEGMNVRVEPVVVLNTIR